MIVNKDTNIRRLNVSLNKEDLQSGAIQVWFARGTSRELILHNINPIKALVTQKYLQKTSTALCCQSLYVMVHTFQLVQHISAADPP